MSAKDFAVSLEESLAELPNPESPSPKNDSGWTMRYGPVQSNPFA